MFTPFRGRLGFHERCLLTKLSDQSLSCAWWDGNQLRGHRQQIGKSAALTVRSGWGSPIEPFNIRPQEREMLLTLRDVSKKGVLGNIAHLFERIFSMIESLLRVH